MKTLTLLAVITLAAFIVPVMAETMHNHSAAEHAKMIAAKKVAAKPAAKQTVKPAPAKKAVVRCPVMGGVVKDTKTAPKSIYKGKTYYFCCPGCKPEFDKNPAKYVKKSGK